MRHVSVRRRAELRHMPPWWAIAAIPIGAASPGDTVHSSHHTKAFPGGGRLAGDNAAHPARLPTRFERKSPLGIWSISSYIAPSRHQ